jgi:hypothetical protein
MTSDVDNLTTFYAKLPSIFETDPLPSIELSSNDATSTLNDTEKTYQPMFGSFLFADSEPFTRAAFVASISPPIEMKTIDENSISKENNISLTPPPPLALVEDISDIDDDDDFDGIPVRHTSTMIKKKLSDDNDLFNNHSEHNNLLDKFVHPVENNHQNNNNNEDKDDNDESFLNGFTDDQQQTDTITIPYLFESIPDIDDLNEQEFEDDDRIQFDHDIKMFDESDSIVSSSPDSLLSSSHLRGDDDDEEEMNHNEDDDDDDVTQWNDDFLLGKTSLETDRPNVPLPPSTVMNIHSHDQVDFIDSSRSNSRCSNASSHLSMGYAEQEQICLNDDELVSSSDSDSDHDDNDDRINFEHDLLNRYNSEEPSLHINLDYHRSRSSSRSSNSSARSSSPIPDQSPIVAIDEDINQIKTIPSAPIAIVDDDDDDDDLETFTSDQPVLPLLPLQTLIQLKTEQRQNKIVHDVIDMRHMLNEHDNDDEFIAIMHNPSVFEDILHDDEDEHDQVNSFPNYHRICSNSPSIKVKDTRYLYIFSYGFVLFLTKSILSPQQLIYPLSRIHII